MVVNNPSQKDGSKIMAKFPLLAGSVFGMLAVILGAFGAHGLKARLTSDMMAVYQTAVSYQMYHALALLLTGLLLLQWRDATQLAWAARMFVLGTLLFSGSLYTLVLSDARWLGAITPIGGVCFIAGWVFLALGVLNNGS